MVFVPHLLVRVTLRKESNLTRKIHIHWLATLKHFVSTMTTGSEFDQVEKTCFKEIQERTISTRE